MDPPPPNQDGTQQNSQQPAPQAAAAPAAATAAPATSSAGNDAPDMKRQKTSDNRPATSLSSAQLEELRTNLQRYQRQITVGCGVAGCTNPQCVTGGAAPTTGAAIVPRIQQLARDRATLCAPRPAAPSAAAAAASSSSVAASTNTPTPAAATASTPAPASQPATNVIVTPAVNSTPVAPASSQPALAAAAAAAPSPAVAAAPRSPAAAAASIPASAAAASLADMPSLPASTPVRRSSLVRPSSAAASSSSSMLSASPSVSPAAAPPPSPSLTALLAANPPSAPLTSKADPILDSAAWVASLKTAYTEWQAKGSPANDQAIFRPFKNQLYAVFNELPALSLSFRIKKDANDIAREQVAADAPDATAPASTSEYLEPNEFSPAIDYEQLDAFYEAVSSITVTQSDGSEEQPMLNIMLNGMRGLLTELTFSPIGSSKINPAFLRAVPILYENAALWHDPSHYETLKLLVKFVSILPRTGKRLISSWMADVEKWSPEPVELTPTERARKYSVERLGSLLGAVQQFISVRILDKQDLRDATPAVVFVSCIYEANESLDKFVHSIPFTVPTVARLPRPLSPSDFYNDVVNEHVDLKQDFRRWVQAIRDGTANTSIDFSFFRYNFILDAGSKANMLRYDSELQQRLQYRDSMIQSGMDQRAGYLILEVRRTDLIADTMRALAHKSASDYKKPLKIHFQGEKGIDAGGLRKEFFQLIIGELFDARYGMFLIDEETRTFRFNPDSLDSPLEFELIGVLTGIAIYQSTIIDLRFPQVYYKQLLGEKPTLEDLLLSQPSLARGLMQLLQFDGDVESTFARDFTFSYETAFGEQKVIELKPNGANIPVTNENRQEFVDLYVEQVMEKQIARQFGAFYKGFHKACGGEALKLFRPFELELLVCGIQELDFDALESTTRYEDGYTKESPVVKWFWEIVHQELSLDEKKKLLEFATGSDRVPIRGLASMYLTISRQGPDSDQLPTSHTCFNHLLIPEFGSKEKLRTRLRLALQNSKGFGLI